MRGELSTEERLRTVVTRLKHGTAKLRAEITVLKLELRERDKTIANLEARLVDKEGQRKELLSYLYKPKRKTADAKPRGKKEGSPAFHRAIPSAASVTEERIYVIKQCPICKGTVCDAAEKETVVKYEEDITLVPRNIVRKHTITRHWCPQCDMYVKSPDVPPIARIGTNTLAYVLYARYRLRLPFGKIKESLSDLHNFKISEGEIAEKLVEAEMLFGKDYEAITELIQTASVVYSDETGWRMEGEHWWLWAFVTTEGTKYVLEDTRGKGVAEKALGAKKDRILVSDGYSVYKKIEGEHQQCWVHLLRAAKLTSLALYADLAVLYHKLLIELEQPIPQRDQTYFAEKLTAIATKKYPDVLAKKTQHRIKRDCADLLTCLSHENVLPENNTAERAIRPQVVMRKIFGGSRSVEGASAHAVNTSVIETLRKQNPDKSFFDTMLPLIEKRHSEL